MKLEGLMFKASLGKKKFSRLHLNGKEEAGHGGGMPVTPVMTGS
jgi:hypothetical protein